MSIPWGSAGRRGGASAPSLVPGSLQLVPNNFGTNNNKIVNIPPRSTANSSPTSLRVLNSLVIDPAAQRAMRINASKFTSFSQIKTSQKQISSRSLPRQKGGNRSRPTVPWLCSSEMGRRFPKGFVWRTFSASNNHKYDNSFKSSKQDHLIFCKQNTQLKIYFFSSKFHFTLI